LQPAAARRDHKPPRLKLAASQKASLGMSPFGIPAEIDRKIRARDTRCVYCGKQFSETSRKDMPSIEHLNEKPPFHWKKGLKEDGLAICCCRCNSSRGNKSLQEWFQSPYCTQRDIPINSETVAEPVKKYLQSLK
jgi:hypothetical protein